MAKLKVNPRFILRATPKPATGCVNPKVTYKLVKRK